MTQKRRAIFSLSAKGSGDINFAKELINLGIQIVSSGGTYKYLKTNGIDNVIDVGEITGFPPILSHRLATLGPKIHGGILAKRTKEHEEEMKEYGIERFEIIFVDIYHVWEALGNPDATMAEVMEMIDIGGPTMLRGAAKNHDNGTVPICDKADCPRVLEELRMFGRVSLGLRQELAQKVFELMARYDDAISRFFARQNGMLTETIFARGGMELAYGENKSQSPAFIIHGESPDPLAMRYFKVAKGEPSYIAYADGNQVVQILRYLIAAFGKLGKSNEPYVAIAGKHANPCGIGVDWSNPAVAIQKCLMGNTRAILGGEVVTNFPIDADLGEELFSVPSKILSQVGRDKWGLDLIMAPEFSEDAVEILSSSEKRRLLYNPNLEHPPLPTSPWMLKVLPGGDILKQRVPNFILSSEEIEVWTGNPLLGKDFENLIIAWVAAWFASSNTVGVANDRMLIGLGAGQQDRVECVRLCILRAMMAGHNPVGSVFASDAFFPFAQSKKPTVEKEMIGRLHALGGEAKSAGYIDYSQLLRLAEDIFKIDAREGTEILRDAGCKGGVVPADGKRLEEVKGFFLESNMSVGFVNKINRGFSKHA